MCLYIQFRCARTLAYIRYATNVHTLTYKTHVRAHGAETFNHYSIQSRRFLKEYGDKVGAHMRQVESLNYAVRQCDALTCHMHFTDYG